MILFGGGQWINTIIKYEQRQNTISWLIAAKLYLIAAKTSKAENSLDILYSNCS